MADEGFYAKLPFNLQEGEKVQDTVKPVWIGYLLKNSLSGIVVGIFLAIFFGLSAFAAGVLAGILVFLGSIIFFFLLAGVGAYISYNKFQVWITNQRIISARGFIGYTTESMPMENINDVIINRGIIDRILGLSSLTAVPIGGYITQRRQTNTVGYIPALKPDVASNLQKDIFDLRNARKKDLKGV